MLFGPFLRHDLFDLVRSFGGVGTSGLSIHLARQVVSIIMKMHDKKVAHKDIKLELVHFDADYNCKLTGFTHCLPTHGADHLPRPTKHPGGTAAYAAPEAVAKLEHDPAKADMWSLGVLLFILVIGRPPCKIADESDTWFQCLKRRNASEMDEFWTKHMRSSKIRIDDESSRNFRVLVDSLLQVNPLRRANIDSVVRSKWLCTVCPSQNKCRSYIKTMIRHLEAKRSTKRAAMQKPKDGRDPEFDLTPPVEAVAMET